MILVLTSKTFFVLMSFQKGLSALLYPFLYSTFSNNIFSLQIIFLNSFSYTFFAALLVFKWPVGCSTQIINKTSATYKVETWGPKIVNCRTQKGFQFCTKSLFYSRAIWNGHQWRNCNALLALHPRVPLPKPFCISSKNLINWSWLFLYATQSVLHFYIFKQVTS